MDDHFIKVAVIGQGSFGGVYNVKERFGNTHWAMKVVAQSSGTETER
jgi:hypothetical protein